MPYNSTPISPQITEKYIQPTVQPQTITLNENVPIPNNRRKLILYSLLIIVFTGLIIITMYAFVIYSRNTPLKVLLPFPEDNPQVLNFNFTYVFEGEIKDVKIIPEGKVITTNITGKNVPRFRVTEQTRLYFLDEKGQLETAKLEDINPHQKITVVALYYPRNKTWRTTKVNILVPSK